MKKMVWILFLGIISDLQSAQTSSTLVRRSYPAARNFFTNSRTLAIPQRSRSRYNPDPITLGEEYTIMRKYAKLASMRGDDELANAILREIVKKYPSRQGYAINKAAAVIDKRDELAPKYEQKEPKVENYVKEEKIDTSLIDLVNNKYNSLQQSSDSSAIKKESEQTLKEPASQNSYRAYPPETGLLYWLIQPFSWYF